MKRALVAGLASTGVRVFNLDTVPLPVTRYAAGALGARGGIYAQMQTTEPGAMELRFLDSRGIDVDTGTERKIENLYFREDARRAAAEDVGMVSYPAKVLEIYLTGYLNKLRRTRSTSNKRVVVACPAEGSGAQILTQVLSELSCEPILVRIDGKGRVKARGALEAVGLRPGLLQASRDVRDPRTRCRTCVGALPGQRSVGEAAPLA
jgi:mannose-1-phosphate guanylyltransferase/phosphomannomutase